MSKEKICISYCPHNGECGVDFDDDDLDVTGNPLDCPSSNDDGYCMDEGENQGCDEWFWENPEDANDYESN